MRRVFLYSTFAHFSYKLPRWVAFCQDGASFCLEYYPHPLFFTQQSHTPFKDMYVHKTPVKPSPKHPFSWPELECGQNELSSGQFGPQLGKMFEKWAILFYKSANIIHSSGQARGAWREARLSASARLDQP